LKTDFYEIFGFPTPADKNTFSEIDPIQHSRMKRNIAAAYSMSSLVGLEQFVDSTLQVFLNRLDELAVAPGTEVSSRGNPANLVQWFQWYAFDVIGELSFSRRLGFLDTKSDVGETCKLLDQFIAYTSAVAMVPEMHKYLLGNPLLKYVVTPPASIIADIATAEIENRDNNPEIVHEDLVEKIMKSQKNSPKTFPYHEIFRHASVNVSAGSETTGITLDALAYYLLKNPRTYKILQDEVDQAHKAGKLSECPRFSETNHEAMPYLAACIKETFRIHPPVSLTLPRHVPAGGVELCGRFLPAGTRVGISAYVVGRNKIFGEDIDVFRPERWLECSAEKLRTMENSCLHVCVVSSPSDTI
jgi:hypothetical protein